MMWRSYLLTCVVLAGLSTIAMSLGTGLDRVGVSTPTTLAKPSEQVRSVTARALTLANDSNHARDVELSGPVRLRTAPDSNDLFVIDDGARDRIFHVAADRSLRDVQGESSKHVRSVSDAAVTRSHLWVVDLLGSSIHVLDRASEKWSSISHSDAPYRIVPEFTEPNHHVVMRIGLERQFDVVSGDGAVIRTFDAILLNQLHHSLALDGFVTRSRDSVIFGGKYLGIVASFSSGGTVNWIADIVGQPDTPTINTRGDRRWLEHGPIPASQAITADADRFYLLSRRIRYVDVATYIDMYASADGAYQTSLELPAGHKWSSIAISTSHLYAASATAVFQWPRAVVSTGSPNSLLSAGQPIITFNKRNGE